MQNAAQTPISTNSSATASSDVIMSAGAIPTLNIGASAQGSAGYPAAPAPPTVSVNEEYRALRTWANEYYQNTEKGNGSI